MPTPTVPATNENLKKHLPGGDELIWMFLLGDMCCFSLFFAMFGHYRVAEITIFKESQALLSHNYGFINTLLLLTSSWFVAMALRAAKSCWNRRAAGLLILAGVLGSGFLALKGIEYQQKLALDIDYLSNNFWVFYYLVTGMHYFHVLLGVPLLFYFAFVLYRRDSNTEDEIRYLECGGIYWHMVDLLWIIIFPLIYLLP